MNMARTMNNNTRLGKDFYYHSCCYAAAALNVFNDDGNLMMPFAYSMNRKPHLSNFCVFSCPIYFKRHINKALTGCASQGIFIGFVHNQAGWLIYSPFLTKQLISANVHFDEKFETALIFDAKPFQGAVPMQSTPNHEPLSHLNLSFVSPEQTDSVTVLYLPSSNFEQDKDLSQEGKIMGTSTTKSKMMKWMMRSSMNKTYLSNLQPNLQLFKMNRMNFYKSKNMVLYLHHI
jgi:hypothetical protein